MPTFKPIDSGVSMQASLSGLDQLWLVGRSLRADFVIPGDESQRLRVVFSDVEITRTLDEMPLSTEEPEKWIGLIPEHFAYEATNAHFWRSQSPALFAAIEGLKHYVFITGETCLDVISREGPEFSVVPASKTHLASRVDPEWLLERGYLHDATIVSARRAEGGDLQVKVNDEWINERGLCRPENERLPVTLTFMSAAILEGRAEDIVGGWVSELRPEGDGKYRFVLVNREHLLIQAEKLLCESEA